jgi:hypothetical protein
VLAPALYPQPTGEHFSHGYRFETGDTTTLYGFYGLERPNQWRYGGITVVGGASQSALAYLEALGAGGSMASAQLNSSSVTTSFAVTAATMTQTGTLAWGGGAALDSSGTVLTEG